MVSSAFRATRNAMKGHKTDLETSIMAQSLIWGAGALTTFHFLMVMLGFDDEHWGWKYKKVVETDEGPKEMIITASNPLNLFPKFFFRAMDARRAENVNKMEKFLSSFSWELHPLYRTFNALVSNKNERGEEISNPYDNWGKQFGDTSWYATSRLIPVLKWFTDRLLPNTDMDAKEARRKLFEEVNLVMAVPLHVFGFAYLRSPPEQRAYGQVQRLTRDFRSRMRRNLFKAKTPAQVEKAARDVQEQVKNYQERVRKILARVQ